VAVVARDTRASGEFLEAAVVAGLASAGIDVLLVGVVPTPAAAFLTDHLDADLGVMLSASHNPMPDNGIKFFARGGSGQADLGIALDGAGIGSAIAANKLAGIRAATCWDTQSAANAREHNHANVLCLGAKMLSEAQLLDTVRVFLATAPGGDRHARRVAKITALEQRGTR